jgi:hypothetical protein
VVGDAGQHVGEPGAGITGGALLRGQVTARNGAAGWLTCLAMRSAKFVNRPTQSALAGSDLSALRGLGAPRR